MEIRTCNCPACGAPIDVYNKTRSCPYCGSILIYNNTGASISACENALGNYLSYEQLLQEKTNEIRNYKTGAFSTICSTISVCMAYYVWGLPLELCFVPATYFAISGISVAALMRAIKEKKELESQNRKEDLGEERRLKL